MKMRTMSKIAASLLAVALAAGVVALAAEPSGTVTGQVTKVDTKADTLTVKVMESGKEHVLAFTANEDTKILKSGKQIRLADVQTDDRVVVNYTDKDGVQIALTIGVQAERS